MLVCEAKCTADHNSTLIHDAHKKISELNLVPVSLRNLIEILQDYDDTLSGEWVDSLRQLWLSSKGSSSERFDLVCYTCGRTPAKASQRSWIDSNQPHAKYVGQRFLEAVEIQLHHVDDLILEVYRERETQNEPA